MWRFISVLLMICFCSSCTILSMPRENTPWGIADNCKDFDCVVNKYDEYVTSNKSLGGRLFRFREGYKDTPIRHMINLGVLTIEEQPTWARVLITATGTTIFAAASVKRGENGDIAGCKVYYEPISLYISYDWIIHEFQHCQGYIESGLSITGMFIGDFTDGQKNILKEEFGDKWEEMGYHWVDTKFYKNEDPTWHDLEFKKI
jgi:hypothetical protein